AYEMLKRLELCYNDFKLIKDHCDKIGIGFLTTPFEEESFDFVVDELDPDYIKISSSDLTNHPLLSKASLTSKVTILSTGMSDQSEIEEALAIFKYKNIILLQCTSEYPAPVEQ